ncbi:MAG: fatty acid desaturase family protein [Proteobacteria bacterium]|nr:fatty acid desaturase family protein [Pseudomonadota bacterium]
MRNSPSAASLLEPAQLEAVRTRSDAWGLALVGHAWVVIIGAAALFVWWPNVLTFALAVILIGSRQLGLLILMHDGAHGSLCRTPWLNRLLAQVFCAWPTFADTDVYRTYHLKHHTRTQQSDDPDIILTGYYPISRASLRRKLTRDLLGKTGYSQRRAQLLQAWGPPGLSIAQRMRHYWRALGPQTVTNLAMAWLALRAGHGGLYLALWLLPLLTWQQLVLRVRNIAEHAVVRAPDDMFGNARTTLANVLERALVAPYWVNLHLEHHLLMWVPCYRLALLRRYLIDNGHGDKIETERGYLAVLRKVTTAGDDAGGGAPRKRASGTFANGFEAV